jgi:general secretion pathway protein I
MRLHQRPSLRKGLTLLEVMVALAIFLFSMIAIYSLTDTASDTAQEIVNESRAQRLLESKMADFVAGVETLGSANEGDFEDEPGWKWNATAEQDSIANLWKVTITISQDTATNGAVTARLTQYILDPTARGGLTTDAATAPSTTSP